MIAANDIPRGSKRRLERCLIVTEEPRSLLSAQLQQALEGQGFAVLRASGAEETLKFCWRNAPSVIFLPQSMRGAAGVLRRIKAMPRSREAIVIVYAERMAPRRVGRLIWEGASDCIAQPFNAGILRAKLRQAGHEPAVMDRDAAPA